MDKTLQVWAFIAVAILLTAIIISIGTKEKEPIFAGLIFAGVIIVVVFGIFGHTSSIKKWKEPLTEPITVTEHPNYIILSTSSGVAYTIKTLEDKELWLKNHALYQEFSLNRYYETNGPICCSLIK